MDKKEDYYRRSDCCERCEHSKPPEEDFAFGECICLEGEKRK